MTDKARVASTIMIWLAIAVAIVVPLGFAAMSPLLQWREPVYILAGFAGIVAMSLLLIQPLLASGRLPGLPGARGRKVHLYVGAALFGAVMLHVGGLWVTSPPDVVDALLFRSPTPFSIWGVIAIWAVFAAVILAVFRRGLRLRPRTWRRVHSALVLIVVIGSVIHALLIEGTMEFTTKAVLCAAVLAVTVRVVWQLQIRPLRPR